MRATARPNSGHSYQELTNSLKLSQMEVSKNKEAALKSNSRRSHRYRKSLSKHRHEFEAGNEGDTPKDTLFLAKGASLSTLNRMIDAPPRTKIAGMPSVLNDSEQDARSVVAVSLDIRRSLPGIFSSCRKERGITEGVTKVILLCMA